MKISYLKQYASALAIVLVMMGLYQVAVVPAMTPLRRVAVEPPRYSAELSDSPWWQSLFPKDAWQNNRPKVLQTPRGILLFSNWQQLRPDQWRLDRLTMIVPQQNRGGVPSGQDGDSMPEQDVWLVHAEKGATIQFLEAFDWSKRKMPPVIGGRLEGEIQITRRSRTAEPGTPWLLTTRDLKIDRRRIWTVEPVEIQWNNSLIRGRDLSIMLKQDLLSRSADDSSPWGVLENLELIYIDQIRIGLPPGGLWAQMKPAAPDLPNTTGLPGVLDVKSGGPFRFDFIESQATLMNGVQATHQLGNLAPDQFRSQELQVRLEPQAPAGTANATAPNSDTISLGGMRLKALSARGMDPVGPIQGENLVSLDAPNIGASARSKRLSMNFVDRQIELVGKLEGAQAVNTVATLNYLGYEFRAPHIQYRQAPNSEHLGWLAASGPGELLAPANSSIGQVNVRWQQTIHMKPNEGDQWISLVGKAFVESKKYGLMASDTMDVWLKPNPLSPHSKPSTSTGENNLSVQAVSKNMQSNYLPDRLKASGHVHLESSQIKALVNELKLWLVHPQVASITSERLPLMDSAGNPMYQFATPPSQSSAISPAPANRTDASNDLASSPPGSTNNSASTAPLTPSFSASQSFDAIASLVPSAASNGDANTPGATASQEAPLTIEGSELQTRIIANGPQNWIDFLTVSGPLHLYRDQPKQQANWSIRGTQLQLATTPDGLADVQIIGAPLSLEMGQATLKTAEVRYNQQTGLVWMDQPGSFQISAEALNQQPNSAGGGRMRWLDSPSCSWKGRLQFDGRLIRIQGDIEMNGTVSLEPNRMWIVNGTSQQMALHLATPVNLRAPKQANSSLDRIVLSEQIDLRAAQTDMQFERISLQRIVAPELIYHLPQGQIVVAGPGDVKTWNRVQASTPYLSRTSQHDPDPLRIQGAHLNFRNNMVAFLDRSEVICEGKVELAAGMLNSWDQMIDLNTMQQLNNDEMLVGCDQLKAYDTAKLQPIAGAFVSNQGLGESAGALSNFWEFQALGNVTFAGKTAAGEYRGNGYRAVYTQSKDMLLLEGDGRTPANVRVMPVGQAPVTTSVISARINTKTMATSDLRITGAQVDFSGQTGVKSPAPASVAPSKNSNVNPRDINKWFRGSSDR